MKFAKLYLKAFGPYSERLIDFQAPAASLHIVYGPNEAGKSSMLRAIRSFLYGIEERSADNFVHENSTLRIGALLQEGGERQVALMRRKGRKSTLRAWDGTRGPDAEGDAIDEAALANFLGGLDKDRFGLLFGIDRDELIRGGNQMLEGAGEVGASLFEAGAGLVGLRRLRLALEEQAAALFAPRASKPAINDAIAAYEEARTATKHSSVRTEEWTVREDALAAARRTLQQNDAALSERRLRKERLGRIVRNLAPLVRREECMKQLALLAAVPDLPPEFPQRRVSALAARTEAVRRKADIEKRVAEFEAQLKDLTAPPGFIEHALLIKGVHGRLAEFQRASVELPRVEALMKSSQERLATRCRELALPGLEAGADLTGIEQLRPKQTDQMRIKVLIREHSEAMGRLSEVIRAENNLRAELSQAEAEFSTRSIPREGLPLKEAIDAAAAMPEMGQRLKILRQEIAADTAAMEQQMRANWGGSLAELRAVEIPSRAILERLSREDQDIASDRRVADSQIQILKNDRGGLNEKKAALEALGRVASDSDLQQVRQYRDAVWEFVRRAYIDRTADPAQLAKQTGQNLPLPEAYRAAARRADQIADLLRRDARRVVEHAGLAERLAQIDTMLAGMESTSARIEARAQRWKADLEAFVPEGAPPATTVRELEVWRNERERVLERSQELERKQEEARGLEEEVRDLRERLEGALANASRTPDAALSPTAALLKARGVLEELRRQTIDYEHARKTLLKMRTDLRSRQQRIETMKAALAEWRLRWADAVAPIGLGAQCEPAEAEERLRSLTELFQIVDELGRLSGAAQVYRATLDAFSKELGVLLAVLGVQAGDRPPAQLVSAIAHGLESAVLAVQNRTRVSNALEKEKSVLAQATAELHRREDEFQALCRLAGASDPAQLQALESQAACKRELKLELQQVERQLLEQNSVPLESIAGEAAGLDRDALQVQLLELDGQIKELDAQRLALAQQLRDAEVALKEIDGGAKSAEAAQLAQNSLARIKTAAQDYVRLKFASFAIAKAVESYRQKHQGPILKRAGEYFATLTCGRFRGLEIDFDDADRQVIAAVRNDTAGRRVRVEGMSEGTRDQLYLSLRLAAIERHLDSGKAIPLIVDDILVQFDDERAAAALTALGMLALKTQVILFTHHKHIVPLATQHCPEGLVSFHTMDYPFAPTANNPVMPLLI